MMKILDNTSHLLTRTHQGKKRGSNWTRCRTITDTDICPGSYRIARVCSARTVRYRGKVAHRAQRFQAGDLGNAPRGELQGLVDGGLRRTWPSKAIVRVMISGASGLAIRLQITRRASWVVRFMMREPTKRCCRRGHPRGAGPLQVPRPSSGRSCCQDKRNLASGHPSFFREGGPRPPRRRIPSTLVGAGGRVEMATFSPFMPRTERW